MRIEIDEAVSSLGLKELSIAPRPEFSKWLIPLIGVSLAAGAILGGLAVWNIKRGAASPQVVRIPLAIPADHQFSNPYTMSLAISPDGTELVYAANKRLYSRSLASFESSPIKGTEGFSSFPISPFFSPDGKWVGFWADSKIFKIPVSGGNPVQVCACPGYYGRPAWGKDDLIIFSQIGPGILRVSASGGSPEVLIAQDSANGERLAGPQILPGGWILFASRTKDETWQESQVFVQSLKTGERKAVAKRGWQPLFLSTGHLAYLQDENLMALPFDPGRGKITGDPTVVVGGIAQEGRTGTAQLSASEDGTLVYLPRPREIALPRLVWVNQKGEATEAIPGRQDFGYLNLSRDGRKSALNIAGAEGNTEIWVFDMSGGSAPSA